MSSMFRYELPVDQTGWTIGGQTETRFSWEYEDGRAAAALLENDNRVAEHFDAKRFVDDALQTGGRP